MPVPGPIRFYGDQLRHPYRSLIGNHLATFGLPGRLGLLKYLVIIGRSA
jgi:hypothetical protein